jgi:DNA-3-methyladenine glycosylase II
MRVKPAARHRRLTVRRAAVTVKVFDAAHLEHVAGRRIQIGKRRVDGTEAKGTAMAAAQGHALADLRRADPVLARVIDANPGFDPRAWLADLPPMDAFGALVFQVIGQQLSVQATRRILGKLQRLFGGALPTARALLSTPADELRKVGLSRRKVATLRDVAEHFADDRWGDEKLRSLSDREVEKCLTTVPGIGPWTVHGFLIIAFDRQDVVLPGDLALRKAIQRVYAIDHLPTQAEVLALAERWRPWRSLATAYLFQAAFEDAPAKNTSALADRLRQRTVHHDDA